MAEILVKQNADINDTVQLILQRINSDANSQIIQQLVKHLNVPGCPDCFFKNLHDYVYSNVRYKLDPIGRERVYKPETTFKDGVGDCKKMTVIIAAALKAAGYNPLIKHVYFNDKPYTHIYVIVPSGSGYKTLDPVDNPTFNYEHPYDRAVLYNLQGKIMDLYTGQAPTNRQQGGGFVAPIYSGATRIVEDLAAISGVAVNASLQDQLAIELLMSQEPETAGIGRRKTKEERKQNRQKLKDKIKNVGLAIPRGAFLGLVSVNFLKFATKLAKAYARDQTRVKNFWEKLGGEWDKLKIAIERGSKSRVQGIGSLAAFGAALATATPVVIAAKELFQALKVTDPAEDQEIEDAMAESEEAAASNSKFDPKAAANAVKSPDLVEKDAAAPPPPPSAGGFSIGFYSFDLNKKGDFVLQAIDLFIKSGIYITAATGVVKQILSYL